MLVWEPRLAEHTSSKHTLEVSSTQCSDHESALQGSNISATVLLPLAPFRSLPVGAEDCFLCSALLPDTCISSLLEAALSGNEEQKPLECTLRPDLSVLVDLALGSSKEPANSLWINMQDYAISKGLQTPQTLSSLSCQRLRRVTLTALCVCSGSGADWDNASLSNESLLDTVSRFVFAALLKHTGLLGQGCGEGRYIMSQDALEMFY